MVKKIIGGLADDMSNCIAKYVTLFLFILSFIFVLYYAVNDKTALTTNTYYYILFFAIPFFFVYYFALFDKSFYSIQSYFSIFLFIIIICSVLYFYSSMAFGANQIMSQLLNILFLIIFLVGLSIVAYVYANYLRSLTGWIGFLANFVFFIPCLIRDFFLYLKEEFRLTSNIVCYVLVLEIILILLYVYLPRIVHSIISQNTIPIMNKSAYLNNQAILLYATNLVNKNPPEGVPQPSFYQNYGISMWIYLNDQPLNYAGYSQETEIFNYGSGKPRITYHNNVNGKNGKDKMIFYLTNSQTNPVTVSLRVPKQKWNYFVFNYTSTNVDLFLNGTLIETVAFSNNFPTFSIYDSVSIGSENGLNGAICNIQFYQDNLSLPQIVNSYNLYMNKNPPINNL
jgi:hypothetical protein